MKEIKPNFSFLTICEYEDLTGKPFNPQDFADSKTIHHKDVLLLIWSALHTADAEACPEWSDFVRTVTPEDFARLSKETFDAMTVFYRPSLADKQEDEATEEEGEKAKNA